ncbi:MAG: Na(+)-translocating NADH-quinone reductase subunit F [Leeuwenhoekiella sp.]
MSLNLTPQELHNLAMNIVGKDLEEKGYEFLAVNSKLKKNPQFVALREKTLHFILVRATSYPDNPDHYDLAVVTKMKVHADKFEAKTFYAGVGLGDAQDYGKPLTQESAYAVVYNGLQEIK